MNRDEYFKFHDEFTKKMGEVTRKKNADYCGPGDDPFANFSRVAGMGICKTEQGFLVRMNDKMSRLATFCQGQELQVSDESVEDTCLDLANYAVLLAGYLKSIRGRRPEMSPRGRPAVSSSGGRVSA